MIRERLSNFFEELKKHPDKLQKSEEMTLKEIDSSFIVSVNNEKVYLEFLYKKKPNLHKSFKLSEQASENIKEIESLLENCYVEARFLEDFYA